MELDVRAVAITGCFAWGVLAMFLTGLGNLISLGYGQSFLEAMASLYPG